MSATRLSVYNGALLLCGERALSALTDAVEARYLLDTVWNNNGVDGCLEEGQWEFAMRTIQIDYDTGITPTYGYARAFNKPTDWILTSAVCSDEFFRVPLTRYVDEAAYWYADIDTIYVRYVSNDANYGGNLAGWPRSFTEFVEAHFASKIILKVSSSEEKLRAFVNPENPKHSIRGRALLHAKSRCAMASPTQVPATGSWSRSRGSGSSRGDLGNTSGNLY